MTLAAAALIRASASMCARSSGCPEIGKFSTARWVCARHFASLGNADLAHRVVLDPVVVVGQPSAFRSSVMPLEVPTARLSKLRTVPPVADYGRVTRRRGQRSLRFRAVDRAAPRHTCRDTGIRRTARATRRIVSGHESPGPRRSAARQRAADRVAVSRPVPAPHLDEAPSASRTRSTAAKRATSTHVAPRRVAAAGDQTHPATDERAGSGLSAQQVDRH